MTGKKTQEEKPIRNLKEQVKEIMGAVYDFDQYLSPLVPRKIVKQIFDAIDDAADDRKKRLERIKQDAIKNRLAETDWDFVIAKLLNENDNWFMEVFGGGVSSAGSSTKPDHFIGRLPTLTGEDARRFIEDDKRPLTPKEKKSLDECVIIYQGIKVRKEKSSVLPIPKGDEWNLCPAKGCNSDCENCKGYYTIWDNCIHFRLPSQYRNKGSGRESGVDCGGTIPCLTTESDAASPPRAQEETKKYESD